MPTNTHVDQLKINTLTKAQYDDAVLNNVIGDNELSIITDLDVTVEADDLTITKNSSDEIQSVATVNANSATGAQATVFNWVGTLQQYTAQNIATTHPEWVCYITDDTSGSASTYSKSEIDALLAHIVIEYQAPTAENNYTWYRKYSDGWVEQGGICPSLGYTVTFPVVMTDVNYTALGTARNTTGNYAIRIQDITTTGMKLNSSASNQHEIWWQVSGIAAQQ